MGWNEMVIWVPLAFSVIESCPPLTWPPLLALAEMVCPPLTQVAIRGTASGAGAGGPGAGGPGAGGPGAGGEGAGRAGAGGAKAIDDVFAAGVTVGEALIAAGGAASEVDGSAATVGSGVSSDESFELIVMNERGDRRVIFF